MCSVVHALSPELKLWSSHHNLHWDQNEKAEGRVLSRMTCPWRACWLRRWLIMFPFIHRLLAGSQVAALQPSKGVFLAWWHGQFYSVTKSTKGLGRAQSLTHETSMTGGLGEGGSPMITSPCHQPRGAQDRYHWTSRLNVTRNQSYMKEITKSPLTCLLYQVSWHHKMLDLLRDQWGPWIGYSYILVRMDEIQCCTAFILSSWTVTAGLCSASQGADCTSVWLTRYEDQANQRMSSLSASARVSRIIVETSATEAWSSVSQIPWIQKSGRWHWPPTQSHALNSLRGSLCSLWPFCSGLLPAFDFFPLEPQLLL